MASETLSQTDIDRLLGGSARLTPHTAAAMDIQSYDWRRPHRISKERLRMLESMYERLVKGLETWLVTRLRGQVEVRLQSVEQFSFGEFSLSLPMPCSSFIFDIAGTGQKGVIDIGPELSTYVVDKLFGGEGSGNALSRALTPIERLAVRSIADKVATMVQDMWKDHAPMSLSITGFESAPEALQVIGRDDPVLVANVEFSAGNVSSLMMICLPFAVLDAFVNAHSQQRVAPPSASVAERDNSRQRSEAAVRASKVPLTARLPDFQLSMRDIAMLEIGSVIPTGIPKDARVIVRAGAQERFIGHPGRVSGNLAIRILDAVPSASSSPDSRTSE
ncbi:MAG: flagellar motor switch protein FliM [Gemmatimonadaceae bacterium]|nr:flagellar motor switch protein FliM [Gemmatimonadaceae bacterium]